MTPALFAQILLLINESAKLAEVVAKEDLTAEQKQQIKDAVRQANARWESA